MSSPALGADRRREPPWKPLPSNELADLRYYLGLDRKAVSASLARRLMATIDALLTKQEFVRRAG